MPRIPCAFPRKYHAYVPTRSLRKIGQHSRDQVDVVHLRRALLRECEISLAEVDGGGDAVRKYEKGLVECLYSAIGGAERGVVQSQLFILFKEVDEYTMLSSGL